LEELSQATNIVGKKRYFAQTPLKFTEKKQEIWSVS
jgi:hypothetical protein